MLIRCIRRAQRATKSEFQAFLSHAADIHHQAVRSSALWWQGLKSISANTTVDAASKATSRHDATSAAVVSILTRLERGEADFRQIGRELFYASNRGLIDETMVNALFQSLPGLIERTRRRPQTARAGWPDMSVSPSEAGKSSASDMVLVRSALALRRSVPSEEYTPTRDTVQEASHDTVLPFWDSGRWHVIVFRPYHQVVLIDPWGLNNADLRHVGLVT